FKDLVVTPMTREYSYEALYFDGSESSPVTLFSGSTGMKANPAEDIRPRELTAEEKIPYIASSISGGGEEELEENIHLLTVILSIFFAGLGIFASYLIYFRKSISAEAVRMKFIWLYQLLRGKYYFDEFYQKAVINNMVNLSKISGKFDLKVIDGWLVDGSAKTTALFSYLNGRFDNFIIDGIVNGVAFITILTGGIFRRIQTGKLQNYLIFILFGLIIFFIIQAL
ncbi:MAG: hypothetical protein ACE5QV_09980, partial [Fidelibacterota bacterium]